MPCLLEMDLFYFGHIKLSNTHETVLHGSYFYKKAFLLLEVVVLSIMIYFLNRGC